MWTPENIIALVTAVGAAIGAVTVLVRQLQHQADPNAHGQDGPPAGRTGT